MFRAAIGAAALLAAAATGAAHAQGFGAYDSQGLTVYGQPRDAYVIRLATRGKDIPTLRREISEAAYVACRRAPRTGNVLEIRPTYMSTCVNQARFDAQRQLDVLADQRRRGFVTVASYNPY
jgi:hypothetical protein